MPNSIFQYRSITDKLICPICQHKIKYTDSTVNCTNIECGTEFPIINNIPVLINEKDSIFSIQDYSQNLDNSKIIKNRKFKNKISKFIPSLSNNLSSKNNFILLEKLLSTRTNPVILIVGGATITSKTEMLFNNRNIVIESDVYFGPRTQIILDGHHLPFEDGTFDLIIFQAVLEHVADPYKCVKQAYRVLKSDGLIFASTPFMQQVHMKQYDFTRFTHLGHRRLFRSFDEIESGVFAGTGVALAWSIKYFVKSIINNKHLRIFFEVCISFMFFWLKYIDLIITKNKGTFNGASGFYFIGKKSNNVLSDKELIKLYKGI